MKSHTMEELDDQTLQPSTLHCVLNHLFIFLSAGFVAFLSIMAHLVVTQAANYATTLIGTNATQRNSIVGFKTQNIRWFEEKLSSAELKIKKRCLSSQSSSSNGPFRVSMALKKVVTAEPQVVQKILVSPLSLEDTTVPPNGLFTVNNAFEAKVISVTRIVGLSAPGETCHIVLRHNGEFPHFEGQHIGVIPPNTSNPARDQRYFSVAASRYGDYFDGNFLSLCVRRRGEVGEYLCNRMPGDTVSITGPLGNPMLLPTVIDPKATFIMVATGTGIGPFRAHLRRLFMEEIPKVRFNGLAWLFLGVANRNSLLYNDEFTWYRNDFPDNFRYDTALSREDVNPRGGKMYIQDKIAEHAQEILNHLDGGAIIYFSGLQGMMPGITDALKNAAEANGQDWDAKLKEYQSKGQWRVEVY